MCNLHLYCRINPTSERKVQFGPDPDSSLKNRLQCSLCILVLSVLAYLHNAGGRMRWGKVVRKQAVQLPSLWSSGYLLLSSRPASSPMLPHADTHSRIEHFASRYQKVWGRRYRKFKRKEFSLGTRKIESGDVHGGMWSSQ